MSNCDHCEGLITKDTNGEERCVACGRTGEPPVLSTGEGILVSVQLHPKTLTQLFSSLAMTQGITPTELLENLGLSKGQGNRMATGTVVYPEAVVALIEQYAITPSDFMTLMKGQAKVKAKEQTQGATGNRRGRRPRREAQGQTAA